jgi:hypothetical protein
MLKLELENDRHLNVIDAAKRIAAVIHPDELETVVKTFGADGVAKEDEAPVMVMMSEPPALLRQFAAMRILSDITERFQSGTLMLRDYAHGLPINLEHAMQLDASQQLIDIGRLASLCLDYGISVSFVTDYRHNDDITD